MISKSVLKVPGGKLVKVEVEHDWKSVARARITGDFFVHPEEALESLEESLRGCKLDENEMVERLDEKISAIDAQLIGFTSKDVATAVMQAVNSSASQTT